MKKALLYFCLLLSQAPALANHPMVRNFTRDMYKSGTQNWAIAQNESNSMYFANNNGLLEFDGKNWTTYPIINGTNVRSVVCTKDGRFYASTFNDFGYFVKSKNSNKLVYQSIKLELGIKPHSSNELYNIYEGDKKVYFQAERSIYQFDGKKILQLLFIN
jgi:hypothetical protein